MNKLKNNICLSMVLASLLLIIIFVASVKIQSVEIVGGVCQEVVQSSADEWTFPLRTKEYWLIVYSEAQDAANGNYSDSYIEYQSLAAEGNEVAIWYMSIFDSTIGDESFDEWIQSVIDVTKNIEGSDDLCSFLFTLIDGSYDAINENENNKDDNFLTLFLSIISIFLLVIAVSSIIGVFSKNKTLKNKKIKTKE